MRRPIPQSGCNRTVDGEKILKKIENRTEDAGDGREER